MNELTAILDVLKPDLNSDDTDIYSLLDRAHIGSYICLDRTSAYFIHDSCLNQLKELNAGDEVKGFLDDSDLFFITSHQPTSSGIRKVSNFYTWEGVILTEEQRNEVDKLMHSVTIHDDIDDIRHLPFGYKGAVPIYVMSTEQRKRKIIAHVITKRSTHEIQIEGAQPINGVWNKIEYDLQLMHAYMLTIESNHMYEDGYRIVDIVELETKEHED